MLGLGKLGLGKVALFIGGTVFGSVGFKLLSSKDAKKVYAHTAAAALRVKESVLDTATTIQENVSDIVAEAKDINEARQEHENIIEHETGV